MRHTLSEHSMTKSPFKFFVLVYVLSIPFLLVGTLTHIQLLPGIPLAGLAVICPVIAAAFFAYREQRLTGVKELLQRSFDFKPVKNNIWYISTILIPLGISFLMFFVMRLSGASVPIPSLSIVTTLVLYIMFFVFTLGEELGWTGYAIDPLQQRFGALGGALVLGTFWAVWHWLPLLEVPRSLWFIAWWSLGTVSTRVIMTWIYNNTGKSVFVAALYHAMINLAWQLFPISGSYYDMRIAGLITAAVAVVVVVLWGPQTLARFNFTKQKLIKKVVTSLILGVGVLGVMLSVLLSTVLPAFRFPKPTGPYAIGTVTYHWVDATRPELFTTDANDHRELMVQVWYPATYDSSQPRALYIQDADVVTAALAQLHSLPNFALTQLKYVTTHTAESVPVANNKQSYPVLIFLEGLTGYRQMNTFQVEEMVSHGYIVVGLDQPGAAASVVFPDGHQIVVPPVDNVMQPLIHQSFSPAETIPQLNGRAMPIGIIPYFVQDVSFTLDQLASINITDPKNILTGKLDLQHTGVFGMSLGGTVSAEACLKDPRLKACLIEDVAMTANVVQKYLQQPSMFITRPVATMRLERQTAGGWAEKDIEQTQTTMRSVYDSLPGDGYFVQVPGMFHIDLTDLDLLSPFLPIIGISGPIGAERAHTIVNAYSVAFFDKELMGSTTILLDGHTKQFPEVIFGAHKP